jgi:glycosyltransferase involved in cell wall biosynthesis
MRILISAASFSSSISGLQRHAFNMVRCLLQRNEIAALHLVVAPWQAQLLPDAGLFPDDRLSIHVAQMTRSSWSRNLWHYRRLPQLAASLDTDLVHLTFPMPVNAAAFSVPTVVTLHDLYPYEIPLNFGFPKFLFHRITLQQCLHNVDAIACVSNATRLRLRHYTPAEVWRKSIRIYNCAEAAPPAALAPPVPFWRGQPFLLSVAQHRRNKNLPLLIRVFARLLQRGQIDAASMLLIVGTAGPETRRIHRLVSSVGLGHRVHFLEGLSESELQWCYRHCEAVVAPSLTEGFGLPVAEGLLAGCRVICSDIPAFREVGGEHCLYVPVGPHAEAKFADAIAAMLQQPKGRPQSFLQFSGPAVAQEYVDLYRRLVVDYAANRRTHSIPAATPEGHVL